MTDRIRQIGGLTWTGDADAWYTEGRWRLAKHRRRDGHVDRDGWYLHSADDPGWPIWAGSRIGYAFKVATVLVAGEWDRPGLRQRDGTVMWRNRSTGEECSQAEVLAMLERMEAGQ